MIRSKAAVKRILGEIPLTAELYWQYRQNGKPLSESFSLRRTEKWLPRWRAEAEAAATRFPAGKNILIFATLRYWIEHAVLIGLALAGQGHQVSLAYLPYANWRKTTNRFDLRRNNAYSQKVLQAACPLLKPASWLGGDQIPGRIKPLTRPVELPSKLIKAVEEVSVRDVQYTMQVEEVDRNSDLYQLRMVRNLHAARSAFNFLKKTPPDVIITPNGSILEMGAIYQVARQLGIPIVTYEFGEQRGRIWLAQNGEVMRQETDALWQARQYAPLSESQLEQARQLYTSRQRADLWQNFGRRWQELPSQGAYQVRANLNLDERPIALLAANVIGDSLTLGRQIFTRDMTEWLQRTISDFTTRDDAQLIVRIHPGERYTHGPSVADVVHQVSPELPPHIHLVAADDPINTYDLIEIADVGLVYTTTVGMEMAMSGVPVLVIGQTHYRGKGFTLDPDSWKSYHDLIDKALSGNPVTHLTNQQVEQSWNYAYRFFFEYPHPFPWHLLYFWDELEEWPLARVLSEEGQTLYGNSFRYLTGEPVDWALVD